MVLIRPVRWVDMDADCVKTQSDYVEVLTWSIVGWTLYLTGMFMIGYKTRRDIVLDNPPPEV